MLQSVDPLLLWNEIEKIIENFSQDVVFDGGFELQKLVSGVGSKDEFLNSGLKKFCNLSRKIRNALSHGKEERSAAVITPTRANFEKLRPWSHLMIVAAGEVIAYNGN